MELWTAKVSGGERHKFKPEKDMLLHLSQAACFGKKKKSIGNDPIHLFMYVGGKQSLLGTLFPEKLPQTKFDLIIDREVELAHSLKMGVVHFLGFLARNPSAELPKGDSEDSEGGKETPQKEEGDDDSKSCEETPQKEEVDDDSKSCEGTPQKKAVPNKKRPAESATKTLVHNKKSKMTDDSKADDDSESGKETPQKEKGDDDSKSCGETSQEAGSNKKSGKTPVSPHACQFCNRFFCTEKGLVSHTKAKH